GLAQRRREHPAERIREDRNNTHAYALYVAGPRTFKTERHNLDDRDRHPADHIDPDGARHRNDAHVWFDHRSVLYPGWYAKAPSDCGGACSSRRVDCCLPAFEGVPETARDGGMGAREG